MAVILTDTMSVSNVQYRPDMNGLLTLTITTGHSMKNPDFEFSWSGEGGDYGPVSKSVSGYTSNPYTMSFTLGASSGYDPNYISCLSATYQDGADSGQGYSADVYFYANPPETSVTIVHASTSSTDGAIVSFDPVQVSSSSYFRVYMVRKDGVRVQLTSGTHYTYASGVLTLTATVGRIMWENANYDHFEAEYDSLTFEFDPKATAPTPTAELSIKVGVNSVALAAASTTLGAGDATIKYVIYADSAMTSVVANSANHTLADGGTDSWARNYDVSGTTTMAPGTTYYVAVVNQANAEKMAAAQFTVPHYTTKVFKEWQKDGVKYDFSTPVTSSFTLTGTWSEAYKVTFKDYDGSVISTQTVVENSATGLVMPTDPTRTGYTFAGWECSLDGHIWDNSTEDVISEMELKATYTQN